jgi:CHASE2 domain-containing sensor protein
LSVIGFCFLRSVPPAVLVVTTAVVNPLNVVSATDKASQDIFFRYIAPLYGNARQPITVILLDDDFVEAIDASWPVPHRTMTNFLKTLYCYRPSGVFFDLLFTHEHSSDRQTRQFIDYLNPDEALQQKIVQQCAKSFVDRESFKDDHGGYEGEVARRAARLEADLLPLPPAYIGDLAPQASYPVEGGSAVFEKLIEAGVPRLPTNWVGDDGAYPLVVSLNEEAAFGGEEPDGGRDVWEETWPEHVDGKLPSTVLALYAAANDGQDLETLVREQQKQLIVEWGFYPQHLPKEAMTAAEHDDPEIRDDYLRLRRFPDGCHVRPDELPWPLPQSLARLKESVWQFLLDTIGILNAHPGQPRQTCPYNQWIPGEAVLFASGPAQQETLRALFEDRIVMIGADIKGAPDLIQTPVHGQIPGVFLHAMALDNLLERGIDGYWRPMPTLPERSYIPAIVSKLSIGVPIEMALLWAIFAFSSLIALWRKRAGERWSEGIYTGAELIGHITLVFATVATLAAYAIAPMNWLGLVALAVSKDILQRFQLPTFDAESLIRLRSKFTQ